MVEEPDDAQEGGAWFRKRYEAPFQAPPDHWFDDPYNPDPYR